jgi:hypothetical protein
MIFGIRGQCRYAVGTTRELAKSERSYRLNRRQIPKFGTADEAAMRTFQSHFGFHVSNLVVKAHPPSSPTLMMPKPDHVHTVGFQQRSHGLFDTIAIVGGIRKVSRNITTSLRGGGSSTSFPFFKNAVH